MVCAVLHAFQEATSFELKWETREVCSFGYRDARTSRGPIIASKEGASDAPECVFVQIEVDCG
jgi:hypothetical protein